MENIDKSKLNSFFRLDFATKDTIWLTNAYTLRKIIGVLGMALPFLLYLIVYIDSGLLRPLESISHYYYTRAGSVFVIVISLMAIFLIVYKGKEPIDFYLSLIAGIFALCVILFPTDNIYNICSESTRDYAVTMLYDSKPRITFHYISAAIFLLSLSYMSLCLFTRTDKSPQKKGRRKILRNKFYITCGVLMVFAISIIFIFGKLYPSDYYNGHHLTFWMEALAIESFGVSWLIKGEPFLKDKNGDM